jgi:hypothetical protein
MKGRVKNCGNHGIKNTTGVRVATVRVHVLKAQLNCHERVEVGSYCSLLTVFNGRLGCILVVQ